MTCNQKAAFLPVIAAVLLPLAARQIFREAPGAAQGQASQTDRVTGDDIPGPSGKAQPRFTVSADRQSDALDDVDSQPGQQPAPPSQQIEFVAPNLSRQKALEIASNKLREAKGDDDKQAARTDVRRLLLEIFEEDMQARERQVEEIEARIEKLRQQYRERLKVKDQIIDLQLKVLENDAAGLEFPRSRSTDGFHGQTRNQNLPNARQEPAHQRGASAPSDG